MTVVQSWFIPLDIFLILCSILIIILSIFVLSIIILDKICHTVPMMLIANTHLSGLIMGCNRLSMVIFSLQNDLKQIQYQDSLCVFRGYFMFPAASAFYYSFLLQALYRYLTAIYPTRLWTQSFRFQILIICSSWLFNFVYPFAFLFHGQIIYHVDDQLCQIPIYFSFPVIYGAFWLFICPISLIMFIYLKLIRFIRQMGKNVTAINTLIRAQRELKMVRRTVILIIILATVCFPFTFMMFMAFFNHTPKYVFRIGYAFVDLAGLATEIMLCQFTDPLKASVMKRIKRRPNRIVPAMT